MLRACLVCGRPSAGPHCPEHRKPFPYSTAEYRAARAQTLAEEQTCWLCGEPPRVDDPLEADHVVAVVDGGGSSRADLHAAHRSCNRSRGAKLGNGVLA
jgi:5-methylcytosine-specific restriction endonuclease McrA